jgi:lauroyl/myristoyl acyltransferase
MRPLRKLIPKRARDRILGAMARAGFAIGRALPRGLGLALFSFLGAFCYYVMSNDRKRTIENLRFVFGGEWSEKKIRRTAKDVFRSLGKNLFDAVNLNTMSDAKLYKTVSNDGLESLEAVKRGGRGGCLSPPIWDVLRCFCITSRATGLTAWWSGGSSTIWQSMRS